MDLNEMRAFAGRYAKAWSSQDPESVANFFSEDGSLTVNDDAPALGRESIARTAESFMTAFPDMVVTMDDVVPQHDGTVFHWTLTGTNSGPGGTGKKIRFSGYEIWQMGDDDLIRESKGHFDQVQYEYQLKYGVGD